MELFSLRGKVAVVTGGAQGIGAATVKLFEECGARVEVLDLAGAIACDVTDEKQVEAAFDRVARELGGVDLLVNSAGAVARKPALELTMEDWDKVLDLNLKGTFLCSRVAARHMKARGGGAIVNLASVMGFSGGIFPNVSYQASKGGVVNLTRALALEWAAENIRVNAVAPTYVRTDLTSAIFSSPEMLQKVMAHTPLGRLPEPEDIAAAVLYLCCPAARCVTGVTLPVDSGYLAR